jgi:hypothetical protein
MKTIEEKNRMIADFMGLEHTLNDSKTNKPFSVNFLYHSSWDWLMPVVEKIERLGFTIEKNFQPVDNDWQCLVVKGNDILFQEFNGQSIQAMHYVVSEFIEMYNNKNK